MSVLKSLAGWRRRTAAAGMGTAGSPGAVSGGVAHTEHSSELSSAPVPGEGSSVGLAR